MEKGARVEIVKGRKGKGTVGTVFWVGENQYGPGVRLGIEGDDGETYWVNADNVEPTAKGPPPEPEEPSRGDRVRFTLDDAVAHGEVFWVGPAKSGRGTRVGVNCDDGETRWLNARQVEIDAGEAPSPSAAPDEGDLAPPPPVPAAPADGPPPAPDWEAPPASEEWEDAGWDDSDPPF